MSTTDPNSPNASPNTSSTRAEGDKLAGCYALSRRLDVGGGAEVWLAHDEVLGKDVSLHFVPDEIRKDTRALHDLRQDIKRNRQLIHPNILRVYDLVEELDWVAISMDAFEGESLDKRLSAKAGSPSKPGEIQPWVEQLANTLEEAHKINVLHRDLSPSNLFLTQSGKLLVASFGISRTIRDALVRAGQGENPNTAFESPQIAGGTPAAKTDDVYSLGAVVYTMLAGTPLFAGKDLAQQVRGGVSAESLAALDSEGLGVPANWRATITASLDKNPEARPQSAAEFGRRLNSAVVESVVVPVVEPAPAPVSIPEPAELRLETPVAEEPKLAVPAIEPAAEPVAKPEPAPEIAEVVEAASVSEPLPTPEVISEAVAPVAEASIEVPKVEEKAEEPVAKDIKEEPKKEAPQKELEVSRTSTPAGPVKSPERPLSTDFTPRLYPEESRFPVVGLAAAAAVIVVVAIVYHFATSGKPAGSTAEQPPEKVELRPLSQPAPPVVATPVPSTPAVVKTQTPAPSATPSVSGAGKAIAEKTAALEKARQAAEAAEKSHAELLKQQQTAEASVAEIQKGIDEKMKVIEPLKKAADEVAAQRKKLEADQKAAEAAALEAQKMAAEKARLAEESAKALAELDKKNAEKIAAPQQLDTEIAALQKALVEKQLALTNSAKALADAGATKKQQLAAVAEQTSEIERLKSTDMEAQRQKDTAETERSKLDKELAEMQRVFNEKMEALRVQREKLEGKAGAPPLPVKASQTPAPATPAVMVGAATTPAPLATPKGGTPAPATPAPATPIKMANMPAATPALVPAATPATTVVPGGNSLGMKFAPVGDVEFCIWQTRVKDFEVFAKAVNLKSTSWKGPGFKQAPDHPVVNVSWQEAIAFCKWLTEKEHKEGTLPANQFYRLPTDLEWSKAVGLPEESGRTPEMRDMGVADVYPWGNQWPPPPGAGNYTGEETGSDVAIKGYDDGFAWTSPVGSFPPNKFGLYDMGGNVWQWCMDTWNAESKAKVLRGASWYNGALKLSLLSSCRVHAAPDSSTDNYGFRIVRAKEDGKSGRK